MTLPLRGHICLMRYPDRRAAGRLLAGRLGDLGLASPVVVALPRGGVPIGFEVARVLGAPLEVAIARKLGAPGRPELGIGAVAEGGVVVLDEPAVAALRLTPADIEALAAVERAELDRRVRAYRGDRPMTPLAGRTAVVVDDGLATGVTARAALASLRRRGAARLVFAAPVCAPDAAARLADGPDLVVCLSSPPEFGAVGRWYDDFRQLDDAVVIDLLERARRGPLTP